MFEKVPKYELRDFPREPGLGNIAMAWNGDSDENRSRYDDKFGSRPDYRLWRCLARRSYHPDVMTTWPMPFAVALDGLQAADKTVVYGVLSVLGTMFQKATDAATHSSDADCWATDLETP